MRFGRGGANMLRFGRAGNVMRFGKRASDSESDFARSSRASNVMRFGRSDKNVMRFGKRSGPHSAATNARIYCDNYNCLLEAKENRLIDSDNEDQLSSLFGNENNDENDIAKQKLNKGYDEYIITK